MSIFCIHDWKLISEKYLESQSEVCARVSNGFSAKSLPGDFFKGTYVQVFACKRCGKIKKFETEGGPAK